MFQRERSIPLEVITEVSMIERIHANVCPVLNDWGASEHNDFVKALT
jgi:hypothetical protein